MKRAFLGCALLLLLLPSFADAVAIFTLQVTIGASATRVVSGSTFVRQLVIQNNAAHSVRVGDSLVSSTRGALLASGSPGGSLNFGANVTGGDIDLSTVWLAGTQNDVIDVVYLQ